jgi:phosphatidylglycerol:prolipoprotein diacylglycerol transferase
MLTTIGSAWQATLAEAWVHDLNPVLIDIAGPFSVRWYGLAYLLAFAIGYSVLRTLAARGSIALAPSRVIDAMFALIVGVIVGGRVGYAVFYDPALLVGFSSSPPWWDLLAINRGGLASHGGMVGVAVAALWIARRERVRFLELGDALAFVTPPGLLLGRLANFINGELLGRTVAGPGEAAPAWSVRFPTELRERPGDVIDALSDPQKMQFFTLLQRVRVPLEQQRLAAGFDDPAVPDRTVFEAIIERIQGGDAQLRNELAQFLNARHPSQLYQALAEGLLVMLVLLIVWRRPKPAGTVGGVFLITYGIGRIATEFYRLPDVGVPRTLGLSRGQLLSSAMIVAGIGLLLFVRARKTAPAGGWLRVADRSAESDHTGGKTPNESA